MMKTEPPDSFDREILRCAPEDGGYVVTLSPCEHLVWCATEPRMTRMYCAECLHLALDAHKRDMGGHGK
jgi:hypothetical protein